LNLPIHKLVQYFTLLSGVVNGVGTVNLALNRRFQVT